MPAELEYARPGSWWHAEGGRFRAEVPLRATAANVLRVWVAPGIASAVAAGFVAFTLVKGGNWFPAHVTLGMAAAATAYGGLLTWRLATGRRVERLEVGGGRYRVTHCHGFGVKIWSLPATRVLDVRVAGGGLRVVTADPGESLPLHPTLFHGKPPEEVEAAAVTARDALLQQQPTPQRATCSPQPRHRPPLPAGDRTRGARPAP